MNWYDIEPKDALDIDCRTRPDLNPPVNEMGEGSSTNRRVKMDNFERVAIALGQGEELIGGVLTNPVDHVVKQAEYLILVESIHQEECLTPCERHDGRHAVRLRSCLECDGHGQEYIGGAWSYCIRCDGAGYDCYGPESYTTNNTVIYGQ